jgi:hypothetical protein
MQPNHKLQETAVVAPRAAVARRTAKPVRVARSLDATETIELQRLFDLIADTCDAAGTVLDTGSDLERLRELTGRVDAMVGRTKSILG